MKTIRFTEVVERSGRPHVHALWVAPDKDPAFVRARKAGRVMTITPSPGGKADIGTIGFSPDPSAGNIYLVFPRSLESFGDARVIGVKYDLVEQPQTLHSSNHEVWEQTGRPKKSISSHGGRKPTHEPSPTRPSEPHPRAAPPEPPKTAPEAESPVPAPGHSRIRSAPPRRTRAERATRTGGDSSVDAQRLRREIKAALAELRDGKTVAAYQRLEEALRLLE